MKTIHYLNIFIYALCVLLICVSYLNENYSGYMILSFIALGISQPILAFILLCLDDSNSKSEIKFAKYYWIGVIIYFLLILLISISHFDTEIIMKIMFVIPPILATYFVFVTYKIQKS